MPWIIQKDDRCEASRPWAVLKQGTNELVACHTSKEWARRHQAALYANEGKSMTVTDQRAKYDAAQLAKMAANGQAMPGGRYPIADREDLMNAIHAVGRGTGSHDAIRKHIMKRAKALGMMSAIPANWSTSGMMTNADTTSVTRAYSVAKDYTACPGDVPYAIHDADGNLIACHATQDDADEHAAALNAGDGPFAATALNADGRPISVRSGQLESRTCALTEVRENKNGGWTIFGYGSTFNDPYPVTDRFGTFTEQIMSGAWDRSIHDRNGTIQLLDSHGGLPYAATNSGTMRVSVDKKGLRFEADLSPRQQRAQDLADAVSRGDVNKTSVGMRIPSGGDSWDGDLRSVHEAALLEISIVNRPANPNTEAGMRNDEILAEIRRLEGIIGGQPARQPEPRTDGEAWRAKHVANLARLYKLL